MQISMPPARPPAGTERSGLGTPWPGGPSRRRRAAPPPPGLCPPRGPLRDGAHAPTRWSPPGMPERLPGRAGAWAGGPGRAPGTSAPPEVGRGLGVPGPPGSAVGQAARSRGSEGPTCQDCLPGVRQLGLPGPGRGGRQSAGRAGRSHGGEEEGRPASTSGPSLRGGALGRRRGRRLLRRRPVLVLEAGRSRQLPGSAPRGLS